MPGKELAGGRRPADPEGDKRSGGREEREHEESRIAAAAVRSRGWSTSSLKSDLGWAIGLTDGLGRIPCGPNVSDTHIQHKTYLHFQDMPGNVSEAYPYPKCIGYGYATP